MNIKETLERYEKWYQSKYLPFLVECYGDPDDLEEEWTEAFKLTPATEDEMAELVSKCGPLPTAYEQLLRDGGYGPVNAPDEKAKTDASGKISSTADCPEPAGGFEILSPEKVLECRDYLKRHFAEPEEQSAAQAAIARGLGPEALLPVAGGGGHDFMIVALAGPEQGKLFRWYHDCSVAENLEEPFAADLTDWLDGVLSRASRCEPTMVP